MSRTPEQIKSDFLRHLEETGQICTMEDGFYYYYPEGGRGLDEWMLRAIADRLTELNKPLNEELEEMQRCES